VIDGCDQSAFIIGKQEHSNRDYFPMFFDHLHVGMRYKHFKVLTHKIEDGAAPIQQLAIPHIYNLTDSTTCHPSHLQPNRQSG